MSDVGVRLSCSDLSGGYGRMTVCRGIGFDVRPGELLAVLGPNGAGKTTMLRSLMGLNQQGGDVILDGRSLNDLAPAKRARFGMAFVPESRGNIFPSMSVTENLLIAGRSTEPTAKARITALIGELFPALGQFPAKAAALLSGGQQQMLAIAMALLADPSVVLLDEPSQGLAPGVLRDIEESLRVLRSSGISIVLAEQNREFAGRLADRSMVITHGRVEAFV